MRKFKTIETSFFMKNKWSKQIILFIAMLFIADLALAQDVATGSGSDLNYLSRLLENTLLWIGAAVVLAAIGALFYLNSTLLKIQKIRLMEEHGIEVMEKIGLVQKESLWNRLYKRATNVVPIEKEKDILFDHAYDGIKELDNSLPPWWVAMFYITIIVGVIYMGFYHVTGTGLSQHEEYMAEMESAEEAVKAYLAQQADQVDETNVELITDDNELALGKSVFDANCAVCHGKLGEGLAGLGPNLTDAYWIKGGNIKDVFKSIKYGSPEKGMIAWKSQFRPSEIQRIASFVMSLQGTNPPNPKEPEGELFQPDNAQVKSDTIPEQIGMNQAGSSNE